MDNNQWTNMSGFIYFPSQTNPTQYSHNNASSHIAECYNCLAIMIVLGSLA